jgi:hypothetical protein
MGVRDWKERASEGRGALILPEKYFWKDSEVVILLLGV